MDLREDYSSYGGGYAPSYAAPPSSYAFPQPHTYYPSPYPPNYGYLQPPVAPTYDYDDAAAAAARTVAPGNTDPSIPNKISQVAPNYKTGDSDLSFSQYFLPILKSTSKLQDEERDPFECATPGRYSEIIQKKLQTRTMTLDKTERGKRYPAMQILQTRCIAPEDHGHETIILTIDTDGSEEQKVDSRCEMRWIHIRTDNPDVKADAIRLDNFETTAMQTHGLDRNDRSLIWELFQKVRDKHEKTYVHGRYLEPAITRYDAMYDSEDGSEKTQPKSATFFSMPYFSVEEACCHSEIGTQLHPVRGLLQTHYELESTQIRDKCQVLRRFGALQNGIYVPQLWCLLLNKDTIITCAPSDPSSLFESILQINDISSENSAMRGNAVVRLSDLNGQIYFLPSEKCQTWFGLLAAIEKELAPIHIVDMMLDDERRYGWELLFDDQEPASGETWAQRIAESHSIHINLTLSWKYPELETNSGPGTSVLAAYPSSLAPLGYNGYGSANVAPTPSYATPSYATPSQMASPWYTPLPPSSPATSNAEVDIELEKKVLASEELLKVQKEKVEKAQKVLATKDAELLCRQEHLERQAVEAEVTQNFIRSSLEKIQLLKEQVQVVRETAAQHAKEMSMKLKEQVQAIRETAAQHAKEMSMKIEMAVAETEAEMLEPAQNYRRHLLKTSKPIEFQDALERKFMFPFAICMNWVNMEDLICQAFRNIEVLEEMVYNGRYDLFVDDEAILPSCWGSLVKPGWRVVMVMWPELLPSPPSPPPPHMRHSDSFARSVSSWSTKSTSSTDDGVAYNFHDGISVIDDVSYVVNMHRRRHLLKRRRTRPLKISRSTIMRTSRKRIETSGFEKEWGPSTRDQKHYHQLSEDDSQNWTTQDSTEFSYSVEESSDSSASWTQRRRRRSRNRKGLKEVNAALGEMQTEVSTQRASADVQLARKGEFPMSMSMEKEGENAESRRLSSEENHSRSSGLEIVSTRNFWWERYRLYLLSDSHFNEGAVSSDSNEKVPEANEIPISQNETLSIEPGVPQATISLATQDGQNSGGSAISLDGDAGKGPGDFLPGVVDTESLQPQEPQLRLRGGGKEPLKKPKAAYVYDVDDDGIPIPKSTTRAKVSTARSPSPVSSIPGSSYSSSFTDHSPAPGVHVSFDPDIPYSESSDNSWASFYDEIVPSDNPSRPGQANDKRRTRRKSASRKGKEKATEDDSDSSSTNSWYGPGDTKSPSTAMPSTSASPRKPSRRLKRRRPDLDDRRYQSQMYQPGNPLMPYGAQSSFSYPAQNPFSVPAAFNPYSPFPPPSTYSPYVYSSPPTLSPAYSSAQSTSYHRGLGGYPVAPVALNSAEREPGAIAETSKMYYTPSQGPREESAPPPRSLPAPNVNLEKHSTHISIFQKLEDKIKADISERRTSHVTSKTPDVMKPPTMPSNDATTRLPPIFRWPIGKEEETDKTEDRRTDDPTNVTNVTNPTVNSSRSIPKFSPTIEDPLITILSDAQEQLNRYLTHFPLDLAAFNKTPVSNPEKVEALKQKLLHGRSGVKASQEREVLLEVGDRLLHAFVPPNTPGSLVGHFWGSLEKIIHSVKTHPRRSWKYMTSRAIRYLKIIEEIQNGVSVSSSSGKSCYRITTAFLPAFEHMVMVFCIFGSNSGDDSVLLEAEERHHRRCEDLLLQAKNQLIRIHAGHGNESKLYKAVDMEGLVALMFKQLVDISSHKSKRNILVEYQKYMSKLELQVLEAPTVRVYDDIQDLVQELTIIETILRQQRTVFEASLVLCDKTGKPPDALSLAILDKGSYYVRTQLNNVNELLLLAEDKKTMLSQAINIRKETNSQAILVFTVMTVVFLPLSFITSYLGMNSTDIRNGAFTQGRFWELSVPLTAVVLLAVWVLVRFKRILGKSLRGAMRRLLRRRSF